MGVSVKKKEEKERKVKKAERHKGVFNGHVMAGHFENLKCVISLAETEFQR